MSSYKHITMAELEAIPVTSELVGPDNVRAVLGLPSGKTWAIVEHGVSDGKHIWSKIGRVEF